MAKLTKNKLKMILRALLYIMLLILFYKFYMKTAIENYMKASTTIAQRQEKVEEHETPITIVCPEPAFKTSFVQILLA